MTLLTVTKIPENNIDLFWLMVSEVSVQHGGQCGKSGLTTASRKQTQDLSEGTRERYSL
jgi:hypothetical protein